jgi:hypothetical protein
MWSDTINNGGNFSEYYGNYDGNMIKIDSEKNIYTSSMSDSSGYKRIMITKLLTSALFADLLCNP